MKHRRSTPAEEQRCVDEFNAHCPIGSDVTVQLDNGMPFYTRTRSAASLLGGHTAVVWVDGIAGAYLLSRVTVTQGAPS